MSSQAHTSTVPTAPASAALPRLGLLLVVALGAIPYLFGLAGDFVYDDETLLLANPLVQDLARLPELVSNSLWSFTTAPNETRVEYWRPLTSVAFALSWAIGGGSPLVFKLVSLAAHLIGVALVARLGRQLTGRGDVALAGALLFAVHPVGIEAVTWASALNDPLMLALGLGAVTSWIAWRRDGSNGFAWRAAILFGLATLAKEAALAFVPLLLALDATVLRDARRASGTGTARSWTPIALWLGAYWLLRTLVFGTWHGGLLSANVQLDEGFARMSLLRLEMLGGGLGLASLPLDLRVFRPFRPDAVTGELVLAILFVALFAGAAVLAWRRGSRTAALLALWPLILLAPLVLRVESVGQFPLSDRFVYATVPGVALLVALALFRALGRGAWLAVALAAVLLGWQGADRTQAWASAAGFWRSAAEQDPDIALVQWNLGRLELEEFQRTPTLPVAQRAFDHFQRALDIAENQADGVNVTGSQFDRLQSYLGTGWALVYQAEVDGYRDLETPLRYFELVVGLQAIREGQPKVPIVPGGDTSHEAWTGRGVALAGLARKDDAVASFQRAIELYPEYDLAHFNKGLVHWRAGEPVPASNHMGRALELQPNNAEYATFAAWAEMDRGRVDRARELAERARSLDPDRADPLVLLGVLERRAGNVTNALELHTGAVELEASNARAHAQLGETWLTLDDPEEALASFVEACRLGPELFEPHWNAASLLLSSGVPAADLVPYLRRAYELCPDPGLLGVVRGALDARLEPGDELRRSLALFDERRGNLEAALYWASTAASANDPDGASAYVFGRLLLAAEQIEAAIEWLEVADRRKPDQFARLRELGSARAAADDARGAREAWERALEVIPPAPQGQEWQEQMARDQIRSGLARLAEREAESDGATGSGSD